MELPAGQGGWGGVGGVVGELGGGGVVGELGGGVWGVCNQAKVGQDLFALVRRAQPYQIPFHEMTSFSDSQMSIPSFQRECEGASVHPPED